MHTLPQCLMRMRTDLKEHDYELILMRGLPGSGKSTKAQGLQAKDPKNTCVLSTDDLFYQNGKYTFDPERLTEYHRQTQQQAKMLMQQKRYTRLIIDNVNRQLWEMKPYVQAAQQYGYQVRFEYPDTPWAWHIKRCFLNNIHGVPLAGIVKMNQLFEYKNEEDIPLVHILQATDNIQENMIHSAKI